MKTFDESQAIAVTCKTDNDLFKLGMGPYCLYHRYVYHSKIQKTNQVWTTDSFMAKDMDITIKTIKKYKAILKKNLFIEVIRSWDKETSKLGKSYVKINHLLGSVTTEIASGVKSTLIASGVNLVPDTKSTPQMLEGLDKDKCLKDDKPLHVEEKIKPTTVGKDYASVDFLRVPEVGYVDSLSDKYGIPVDFIVDGLESCVNYLDYMGKKYKDHNKFFINWIKKDWSRIPDWKKENMIDRSEDGIGFSGGVYTWRENGKVVKEFKTEVELSEYVKTKGVNFVPNVEAKPDEYKFIAPSTEQIQKDIKEGKRDIWKWK